MIIKKPRSDYYARTKFLIMFELIDKDYTCKNGWGQKRTEHIKKFWAIKFKHQLNIEKARVIIDDQEYLITYEDGVLSKLY